MNEAWARVWLGCRHGSGLKKFVRRMAAKSRRRRKNDGRRWRTFCSFRAFFSDGLLRLGGGEGVGDGEGEGGGFAGFADDAADEGADGIGEGLPGIVAG